ncbi:MAG: DNA cytosine methyltransferase [bacterium]|nr:DNA cytosine methyltransferase [bacterium]
MRPIYSVVDLFAGCGGLTAGFLRANSNAGEFRPIASVDSDVDSAATYAANFGNHVFLGSIEDWLGGAHYPDRADVVLGGPPCQGFSQLGKQDVTDQRNALWEQYVEAVGKLQPKFFVLENVREFLKSEQCTALARACEPGQVLEEYEIERFVLDSSLYGAPQRRRRAIVIGRRRGQPLLGEPLQTDRRRNVSDAFDGLNAKVRNRDLPYRFADFRGQQVPGPFIGNELHVTRYFTQLSLKRYRSIPPGGNRFDIPYHLLAPCWRTHRTGSADVMGRLFWDKPSVTIRTEFYKPEKGRYLHPIEDRPITHLEASRLQGFPDDYKWFGSKYSIARQIGNAVPLQLGQALGCHILTALSITWDSGEKIAA